MLATIPKLSEPVDLLEIPRIVGTLLLVRVLPMSMPVFPHAAESIFFS